MGAAGATFGGKAGQNILQSLAQVGNLGGAFSGRKWVRLRISKINSGISADQCFDFSNLIRNVSGQSDELENYRAFKRSKD